MYSACPSKIVVRLELADELVQWAKMLPLNGVVTQATLRCWGALHGLVRGIATDYDAHSCMTDERSIGWREPR